MFIPLHKCGVHGFLQIQVMLFPDNEAVVHGQGVDAWALFTGLPLDLALLRSELAREP